jgi:hypothetical protein
MEGVTPRQSRAGGLILRSDAEHCVSKDGPARSFVGASWSVLRDASPPATLLMRRAAWGLRNPHGARGGKWVYARLLKRARSEARDRRP